MAATIALMLTALAMRVAAGNAVSPQCGAQSDEAPRAGSAMLQTSSASKTAPLSGRVVTLEAEMTSLEERVAGLEDSIGVSGGAVAGGAALQQVDEDGQPRVASPRVSNAAIGLSWQNNAKRAFGSLRGAWMAIDDDNSNSISRTEFSDHCKDVKFNSRKCIQAWRVLDIDRSGSISFQEMTTMWDDLDTKSQTLIQTPYARYALLLRSIGKADSATLKEDVASLESRAAAVKSQIMTLENQVSGNGISLLSDDDVVVDVQGAKKGTSLESRVNALEDETSDMRTRVTSLEQTIVGLQLKAKAQ